MGRTAHCWRQAHRSRAYGLNMVKYIGGEAIEAIDAEASVYGKGRGSEKFVIMIKLNASFVAIA